MSNKFSIKGKITMISPVKNISEKFTMREFILETGSGQYPNPIKFQVSGKYLDIVNESHVGLTSNVDFYINGRRAESGSHWNSLTAVLITADSEQKQQNPQSDNLKDDMPF